MVLTVLKTSVFQVIPIFSYLSKLLEVQTDICYITLLVRSFTLTILALRCLKIDGLEAKLLAFQALSNPKKSDPCDSSCGLVAHIGKKIPTTAGFTLSFRRYVNFTGR